MPARWTNNERRRRHETELENFQKLKTRKIKNVQKHIDKNYKKKLIDKKSTLDKKIEESLTVQKLNDNEDKDKNQGWTNYWMRT